MSSASGVISFRILTGPHMGAEVVLPAGTLLIGSDDSCDIILQDGSVAPRHAEMRIVESENGLSVHLAPLDKAILIHGEAIPAEGCELPALTPCFLGLSCLAWAPSDESGDVWQAVLSAIQETGGGAAPGKSAAPVLGQSEEAAQRIPVTGEEDIFLLTDQVDGNAVGSMPTKGSPENRVRRTLTALVALLCLCGLVFSYAGRSPDPAQLSEQFHEIIANAGFGTLKTMPMGQGVAVFGTVGSDAERAVLLNLARNVHYPVYLDLVVQGDRVAAVRTAFNSRGFFPRVDEVDGRLRVALYMKDGLAEEWAFSSVRDDIPELRDPAVWDTLERVVLYARDVEPVLRDRLKAANLEFVGIRFLSGQVELAGEFDSEQQRRLTETLDAVSTDLGVPVVFSVVPSFARANTDRSRSGVPPSNDRYSGSREKTQDDMLDDPLGGTQVTGVTLSPLKFISLSNGQRIFEGGILPGGYTLETVDVRVLTLRKGGQTLQYPLRGSQDE